MTGAVWLSCFEAAARRPQGIEVFDLPTAAGEAGRSPVKT
jgi:hypothetical protein